ncbi:MAG: peptidogalycan biosysnthesis protein, partial [Cyanobacteria bacterium J06588_4]
FPATANHSLHRFYNPRMAKVLHNYIDDVNRMSQEEITAINDNLPFNREEISFSLD